MLLFASGSCRVLTPIYNVKDVDIIHGIKNGYYMEDSMGYLFNIKQHIQFLQYLKNEIEIPDDIRENFFHVYSAKFLPQFEDTVRTRKKYFLNKARDQIKLCKIFIFEICSLKIYEDVSIMDNLLYQSSSFSDTATMRIQAKEDFISDLDKLVKLCPEDSIVILQIHIRPHILNKDFPVIESRNIIHDLLSQNVEKYSNVRILDPSLLFEKELVDCKECFIYFTESGNNKITKAIEKLIL